jgi:hypothetical protein
MATGAAAVAVTGTAVSIAANNRRARMEARAAREQAEAKREAAFEILARAEENAELTKFEAEGFKQDQVNDLVSRGMGDTLNTLAAMEDTNNKVQRQLDIERREAEFQADQLFAGADISERLAGDIKKTARLENLGLFLQGTSSAIAAKGGRK